MLKITSAITTIYTMKLPSAAIAYSRIGAVAAGQ